MNKYLITRKITTNMVVTLNDKELVDDLAHERLLGTCRSEVARKPYINAMNHVLYYSLNS